MGFVLDKLWLGLRRIVTIGSLSIGIVITCSNILAKPAQSAEQIRFWYPPVGEFTIYIKDLEQFAKKGKLSKRLEFYLGRLSSEQQSSARNLSHPLQN